MAQHANWNRRHFKEAAELIRNLKSHGLSAEARDLVARDFADMFEDANSGFDRRRFLTECGVDPDEQA